MSEKPMTSMLDEAIALWGDSMKYKVLEDGSIYFYTEEYAQKNSDIALHSPQSRSTGQEDSGRIGHEDGDGKDLSELSPPRTQDSQGG